MIKMTRTYNRPSIDVKWFVHSDNVDTYELAKATMHIWSTYKQPGLLLSETMDFSDPNALSVTYTGVWLDRESFDTYDYDAELLPYWAVRDAYHASVGITLSPKQFENI